jgi:hypothetical protein
MKIEFNLPHVFSPIASTLDNACALRALLNCMIELNLAYLRHHPGVPILIKSGVVYGRTHIWEPIPALYLPNKVPLNNVYWTPEGATGGQKRGDCKSLGTARVAELRYRGIKADPVFRWAKRANSNGSLDFHILVQTNNGYQDPSRELGMGAVEVARYE